MNNSHSVISASIRMALQYEAILMQFIMLEKKKNSDKKIFIHLVLMNQTYIAHHMDEYCLQDSNT